MMKSKTFISKLKTIATDHKTKYMWGGVGGPITQAYINDRANQYFCGAGAVDALLGAKPSTLTTDAKTIVPAINELKDKADLTRPIQCGAINLGEHTANTTKESTVTFPTAFPSGKTVRVVAMVNGTTRPDYFSLAIMSASTSGFVINSRITSDSASCWIYWIATVQ